MHSWATKLVIGQIVKFSLNFYEFYFNNLLDVVAFRADSLAGPWSQPFTVAPLNTRTYNSQSGFSLRIKGKKKTTYLYLGDQVWCLCSLRRGSLFLLTCNLVGLQFTMGESLHLVANGNWRQEENPRSGVEWCLWLGCVSSLQILLGWSIGVLKLKKIII